MRGSHKVLNPKIYFQNPQYVLEKAEKYTKRDLT